MFNKTGINSNLKLKVAIATGIVGISLISLPAISQTTSTSTTSGSNTNSTLTNQNAIPTTNLQGFSSLINGVPATNGTSVNGVSNISSPSFVNGVPVLGTTNNGSNATNTNSGTTTGNNLNSVGGIAQNNGLNTGIPQLSTFGGLPTSGVIPQVSGAIPQITSVPQINTLGTLANPTGTTNVGGVNQGNGFATGVTSQPANVGGVTTGGTIPQINGTVPQIGTFTNPTGTTNVSGVNQGNGFATGVTSQPANVGGVTTGGTIPQINGTVPQIGTLTNPTGTTNVNGQ